MSVFSEQGNNDLNTILKNQFKGIKEGKQWQINLTDNVVVKRTPSGSITLFHDKQQQKSFHIHINEFIDIKYDGSEHKCKIHDLRQKYRQHQYDISVDLETFDALYKTRNVLKELNLMETVSFLEKFKKTLEHQRANYGVEMDDKIKKNLEKNRISRALTVAMQYMESEKTKSKMRKNYTGSLLCCWNGATEAGNLEQIQNANNKINKE